MDIDSIKTAIEKTGSIRKAAKLLGKPYTSIQWALARAGYRVVKKHGATIEPIPRPVQPDSDQEQEE